MSGPHSPAFEPAPAELTEAQFMRTFGAVYEDSPWVARQVWESGEHAALATVRDMHRAMRDAVAHAPREALVTLIRAHPDLAGRAARAGDLSADSAREQAGAGLDRCTDAQYEEFMRLNDAYRTKFSHPFIIAVGGLDAEGILRSFRTRLGNTPEAEFDACLAQIHRIAYLRLLALAGGEGAAS